MSISAIVLCLAVHAGGESHGRMWPSLTAAGISALRGGSYRQAIGELRKKESDPDTAARLFRLAFAYACSGDTGKALSQYRLVANASDALSPLAWDAIGDIIACKKLADSALACYGRALAAAVPATYREKVFGKIHAIIGDDTAKTGTTPFRAGYLKWWIARSPPPPDSFAGGIDSLIGAGLWKRIDSIIGDTLNDLDGATRCAVVKSIERNWPPDSELSTESLFRLAGTALDCRRLDAADRLLEAAKQRSDFGKLVSGRALLRFRGNLFFFQRKYRESIEEFRRFVKTYHQDPDILLLIARAYHNLDMIDESAAWYDRYFAQSPRNPKLSELLWRRAWMDEKRNRPVAARRFYQKIISAYPRSQRAEESWIRLGLSYYRVERYDSALKVFSRFEAKNGASNYVIGARYWSAKCCISLHKYEKAKELFAAIARGEPYNFYAFRAREYLSILGDSAAGRMSFDTTFDHESTMLWLDSITPSKKAIAAYDSINYRRGLILASIGSADATFFLASVEDSYPDNLSLAFKIGILYRFSDATYRAAYTGRRFSWRIPAENRVSIGLPIYALMYPLFFKDIINAEAARWNIDPYFVYAVIRQESVFHPAIVSPAGAIGLMQIMPATGREIAQDLKEPFAVDSLYLPSISIRYGTYYLRKLLDQFNDNEVLAIASYNGGPHNAKAWYLRNKDKDIDLFVEDIDFSETRSYVKKVMANFWFYRKLSRLEPYLAFQ